MEQICEVHNFGVATSIISRITDKVSGDIFIWQDRLLKPVYLIVWMDGIVFKVRESSKVTNKTVHIAIDLRRYGKKEILRLWRCTNESAAF